jgi:hypothetical protein
LRISLASARGPAVPMGSFSCSQCRDTTPH